MPPATTDLAVGTRVGRFAIIAKIGAGATCDVYRARATDDEAADGDRSAPNVVAVRVLRRTLDAGDDEAFVRRFLGNARAVKEIESPHVVRVLDIGIEAESGSAFVVTELLEGKTLDDFIATLAPVTPRAIVTLIMQACGGLAAAHASGIVHRALDPADVFVHVAGGALVVKVCDFGAVRPPPETDDDDDAEDPAFLRESRYMAPEQSPAPRVSIPGTPPLADARTDVFRLCLCLHHALSGRAPRAGETTTSGLRRAAREDEVPSLAQVAPWLDRRLARVVQRGLAHAPDQRFASMTDLATALMPFTLGRPPREGDLEAVSAELRTTTRATPDESWRTGIRAVSADDAAAMTDARAERKRRRPIAILVAGLLLLGAVATVAALRRTSARDATPTTDLSPPPTPKTTPREGPSAGVSVTGAETRADAPAGTVATGEHNALTLTDAAAAPPMVGSAAAPNASAAPRRRPRKPPHPPRGEPTAEPTPPETAPEAPKPPEAPEPTEAPKATAAPPAPTASSM